ncbi:Superfamily II DNA or RNA helicase [Bacillus sp. OV166]|uniref:Helicase associated domain protein n=1 Tax=Bacillus sp. OV166 TaxID=1882763 RepID=UPI000A2AE581|nr:Helicase associated domain protein [Bacillus sp. OV166]SMQ86975.1 Superfamily II DNA or RNA helicase [Bacillus sp. OV166]
MKNLIKLTKEKKCDEIKHYLENIDKNKKGAIFEEYLKELYIGNGWIAVRKGGKNDAGADILLYHPKTPLEVSMVIQGKNQIRPLSFDDTRTELRKFEEEASLKYDCKQYALISINGFVSEAEKLNPFNMRLDNWEKVKELINGYDPINKKEPEIDLYNHNQLAYQNMKKMWIESNRVAVVQATGTGKSFLIIKSLSESLEQNKLVLAPSHFILEEIQKNAAWAVGNTLFMTYSKAMGLTDGEIRKLNISLLVLDEFHRCGAEQWGKGVNRILNFYHDFKVLGTSATPIRYLDGSRDMSLELFDGNVANELSLPQAIIKEILPKPTYISALYTLDEEIEDLKEKIDKSTNSIKEKQDLLNEIHLFKADWEKSNGIPNVLKKYIRMDVNKFIVFCEDKAHLEQMEWIVEKWFKEAGFNKRIKKHRVISGESWAKEELQQFQNGKNKKTFYLLFAIDMLNEGLHVDDVDGVILLRPTESPIIFYQQLGRALQTGKVNNPLIFDLVNNFRNIRANDFTNDLEKERKKENEIRKLLGLSTSTHSYLIFDETKEIMDLFKKIEKELKDNWDERYEELILYNDRHGNCLVPERYKENPSLGIWVRKQRDNYKNGVLSLEKVERLNELGLELNSIRWEEMYQELKTFHDEKGHCLVPQRYKENPSLAKWVLGQRQNYSQGDLSQEKIQRLNELGFVWGRGDLKKINLEEQWEEKYQELLAFKEKHGHCSVPQGFKENPSLASWISNQRTYYKTGTLSQERVERLNELGFVWGRGDLKKINLEEQWEEKYQELLAFKEKHGHCSVPQGFKENPSLASWISNQRTYYKTGTLSQERVERLNELGFIWEAFENQWEKNFQQLISFKDKYGHSLVPKGYKENPALANWIAKQRISYNDRTLSQERIERLNELGFIWDKLESQWEERFRELTEFRNETGHCLVPHRYKENPSLGRWAGTQRNDYIKDKLSQGRIERLNELGFVWEVKK